MIEMTLEMAERAARAAQAKAREPFWANMPIVVAGQALPSPGGTGEQDPICSDAGASAAGEPRA